MAHSVRSTPIIGCCKAPRGMRAYKRRRAKQERTQARTLIHQVQIGNENAAAALSHELAPWDKWASPRDGKSYVGHGEPRLLRK
jgi:hypothetical protein